MKRPSPMERNPTHPVVTAARKLQWKPGTMLNPVPVVMVSCAADGGKPNIITIAWVGTVCSEPPMLAVAIRPERHSYEIIRKSREFAVNLPSEAQLRATDKCGVISGRTVDKFKEMNLTAVPGVKVKAPIIAECPINIECRVHHVLPLGSHALFIAEILNVQVSDYCLNKSGRLAIERLGMLVFAHGHYYALGRLLGHFGFSVRKSKKRR